MRKKYKLNERELEKVSGGLFGSKDPQTAIDIFDEQIKKALEAGEKL